MLEFSRGPRSPGGTFPPRETHLGALMATPDDVTVAVKWQGKQFTVSLPKVRRSTASALFIFFESPPDDALLLSSRRTRTSLR